MSRISGLLTLAVAIAVLVAMYLGGFAPTQLWGAGLAASGGYAAWTGQISYGIRGGRRLGEAKGWWVRLIGALLFILGATILVHPRCICVIDSRLAACA
jgi:hypothetical protein